MKYQKQNKSNSMQDKEYNFKALTKGSKMILIHLKKKLVLGLISKKNLIKIITRFNDLDKRIDNLIIKNNLSK